MSDRRGTTAESTRAALELEQMLSASPFRAQSRDGRFRTRRVYRPPRTGPPVIVIHEAMGLTTSTLAVAARIRERGLTPILPLLVGSFRPGRVGRALNFAQICILAEFGAWARNRASPIADWLQALAAHEARQGAGAKVGAVGMCFSGGYALAMAREPGVAAAVASQPSLPLPIGGLGRQVGLAPSDCPTVSRNTANGRHIRALRYQLDRMSPPERHARIGSLFPDAQFVVLPSRRPWDHSVLSDGVDTLRRDVAEALEGTLDFLAERLLDPGSWSPPPA